MPIDYSSLRGLTARRLVTALQRDGFTLARRKGATRFFKHPDGRRVTIHLTVPDRFFLLAHSRRLSRTRLAGLRMTFGVCGSSHASTGEHHEQGRGVGTEPISQPVVLVRYVDAC